MGAGSNELWAKAEVLKMLLCSWGRFCTDRQSRRSAQAQEYCRMKLWEFQCDRARGRMFPAGDMVGSDCFPYTKQKPFWVCGRAQPSDAGRVLGSSCAAVMEMCWHLQSEHSLWMDHAQSDEVGFVLWAPWNQNTAGRHLEKKNLASLGRLLWAFFFFFLHLKKEEFVSVPDERREVFLCLRSSAGISGSFSAGLHCGPLCWGRHNLSCHLAPCSPELSLAENFYFLWHKHLNWQIFPLSTLFIEGVCDGGMEVQRKIFLLGKKESSQRGAVISGHYLSSDNNYYRTITSHPSHLNIWCNKAPCPAQWPSKTPLPFQTFARITSVKISFLLFSLKIKFSRFSLTALKF